MRTWAASNAYVTPPAPIANVTPRGVTPGRTRPNLVLSSLQVQDKHRASRHRARSSSSSAITFNSSLRAPPAQITRQRPTRIRSKAGSTCAPRIPRKSTWGATACARRTSVAVSRDLSRIAQAEAARRCASAMRIALRCVVDFAKQGRPRSTRRSAPKSADATPHSSALPSVLSPLRSFCWNGDATVCGAG